MTSENITGRGFAMIRVPSFFAVAAGFGVSRRAAIPLALAGAVLWAVLGAAAAHAATMHRVYILRYVDHTTFCPRSQAGADGLVVGDGTHKFEVVCEPFGPGRWAWDAERWAR